MAKQVKQKEINFLTVLTGRSGKKRFNPRVIIVPGVLLLVIIAGVGFAGYLHMSTSQVEAESNTIREYLNSPSTNRQISDAETAQEESQTSLANTNTLKLPMDYLATYPDMTSDKYRAITDYAGANIEISSVMYDRNSGVLSFNATSGYVLSIPTFISQLRNSGMFTDITYNGYAGNSAVAQLTATTDRTSSTSTGTTGTSSANNYVYTTPLYSFEVICQVKPPEAQEAPAEEAAPEDVEQAAEGE